MIIEKKFWWDSSRVRYVLYADEEVDEESIHLVSG